jgi:hypothetical protein
MDGSCHALESACAEANHPSKLARSVLGGMRADWSPIARLELPIQFLLVHLLPHASNVELLLPLTEIVELLLAPSRRSNVSLWVVAERFSL